MHEFDESAVRRLCYAALWRAVLDCAGVGPKQSAHVRTEARIWLESGAFGLCDWLDVDGARLAAFACAPGVKLPKLSELRKG